MSWLLLGLVLVPLLDQAAKWLVRDRLRGRALTLGALGYVQVVQTQIWAMRARTGMSLHVMWGICAGAAAVAAIVCTLDPAFGWPFGLMLGGALSHALETTLRGSISDYVCLRFWPAFNLADVALGVGALGIALQIAFLFA
jgi:signal peptidase II